MFNNLAQLIISLLNLLESEGRLLRFNIFRTVSNCGILIIGLLFIAAGLVFFVAASYKALIIFMPQPVALAVMGLLSLILGLILMWIVCRKKPKTPQN